MSEPKYQQLLRSMPNHGGTMLVNGEEAIYSFLELSKPTGKYVWRFTIRLINFFMRKHYFRYLGNSCTPGLAMSKIDKAAGIAQFDRSKKSCGVIIGNVFGLEPIKDGIVIEADPFMQIEIRPNWEHFDDYKSAMSSKYRIRTNRVFALSEGIEMRNLNTDGLGNWIIPCAHLLNETLKHKTITLGKDLALLLRNFHEQLDNKYQVNGYFKNGQLIGFISYINDGSEVNAMHLGYELAIGTEVHLYQRMMYDLIAYSIENKKTLLHLGRTAPEIKSTMGAVPVENSFVFFSSNLFIKWLVNFYAKRVHKPLQYTLRHPFKTK